MLKLSYEPLQVNVGGQALLSAVETIGGVLKKRLKRENSQNTTIVQKNIAVEVMKVDCSDVVFPSQSYTNKVTDEDAWIRNAGSQIHLERATLNGKVL